GRGPAGAGLGRQLFAVVLGVIRPDPGDARAGLRRDEDAADEDVVAPGRGLLLLAFAVLLPPLGVAAGGGVFGPGAARGGVWLVWSRMNSQSPCSRRQACRTRSARRSRVTQSFDQPSRARKRTSCALWRGSVRMESAAWQAEWRVSRQATTKRVSRPTVEA